MFDETIFSQWCNTTVFETISDSRPKPGYKPNSSFGLTPELPWTSNTHNNASAILYIPYSRELANQTKLECLMFIT